MLYKNLTSSLLISLSALKMSNRLASTVAVCQMTSTSDRESNFKIYRELVADAKAANASMVFFPEGCDYIASSVKESLELVETPCGELMKKYCSVAQENNIWVSLGGVHFKTDIEGKLSNSSVVINSAGSVVACYEKTHLFDVDLPEKKVKLLESSYVKRGAKIVAPVSTPIGSLGLAICYDMRFPELSQTLRNMGAEILTFPSAFTFETGASHWETLLTARAVETQSYVIAAAQTGAHNQKRRSWGHAMVIDPWGNVVAQCTDGTGFALAHINLSYVQEIRRNMPIENHRRTDLYPQMPGLVKQKPLYEFGQVTVPNEIVFYTSPLSIAFTNKRCVVPGHVLVAPIRKALRISDLTPAEICDLFSVVQKVEKVMEKVTGANSTTIAVQDGPDAGQTIRHVHVHILPRKPRDFQRNDDIYDNLQNHDKTEDGPWRTEDEMSAEAAEIRKYFTKPEFQ